MAWVGCAAQGHGWAYNSCGDPNATEIVSPDGALDAGPGAGFAHIDTNTLLDEMRALRALAGRPPSFFKTCMVSSYDRHSTVPQTSSDTPTGWFANHDWGNYVGQETGPAGESEFVLLDADGPGAVVRVWSPSRDGKPNGTLRIYVDRGRFDGQETVRVPLGDFFGAGPGLLPHSTLVLDAGPDGVFTARFVMPFAQSAVVRVDAAAGLEATVTVLHQAAPFDSTTYYFHAHWSARGPMAARPYRDLLLADVTGEGAYVGTFLAVGNSSTAWWGEGDEKVWVDSEAFPSLFGTGTEDYFGQGYCSPDTYNHPYRAQALAAGDFGSADGLFSMLRTHVLDPIRFATSLKFNLPMPTAADFRLSPFGQ